MVASKPNPRNQIRIETVGEDASTAGHTQREDTMDSAGRGASPYASDQ